MKNIINYFYGFNNINVFEVDGKYYFNYNDNNYYFLMIDRSINELDLIKKIYSEIRNKNIFSNKIILNKQNQILTIVNNVPYVLVKDDTNGKVININDILFMQNNTANLLPTNMSRKDNWINLWMIKTDYYEDQIKEIIGKYDLLTNSIDYYIGLSENAISYLVNNNPSKTGNIISHRRIDCFMNSFDFYNPVNYILDSRVRDFSEYVKSSFFHDNLDFNLLVSYLNYINFNKDEYILFISRLLFPTYYYDLYDNIINKREDENAIKKILNKNNDYILLLKNIFYYVIYTKRINIPVIEWIMNYN